MGQGARSLIAAPRFFSRSAAGPEPSLADGVAGVAALPEELLVGYDSLTGMDVPAVSDIRLVIRDADHQTRRLRREAIGDTQGIGGAIEQPLQI
jgi:hypothetical protein